MPKNDHASPDELDSQGFRVLPSLLQESVLEDLIRLAETLAVGNRAAGSRDMFETCPAVLALAASAPLLTLAREALGEGARPVRCLYFDKNPDANWKVPWHQDLTVAVAERRDTPGFGPWSVKGGVIHAQAPVSVLEGMVALRLHLDECGPENGALRFVPGSHRSGKLGAEGIRSAVRAGPVQVCPVVRGGLLLMKPLLLHASSSALSPRHRRVIHIEYAAADLPGALRWNTSSSA